MIYAYVYVCIVCICGVMGRCNGVYYIYRARARARAHVTHVHFWFFFFEVGVICQTKIHTYNSRGVKLFQIKHLRQSAVNTSFTIIYETVYRYSSTYFYG